MNPLITSCGAEEGRAGYIRCSLRPRPPLDFGISAEFPGRWNCFEVHALATSAPSPPAKLAPRISGDTECPHFHLIREGFLVCPGTRWPCKKTTPPLLPFLITHFIDKKQHHHFLIKKKEFRRFHFAAGSTVIHRAYQIRLVRTPSSAHCPKIHDVSEYKQTILQRRRRI